MRSCILPVCLIMIAVILCAGCADFGVSPASTVEPSPPQSYQATPITPVSGDVTGTETTTPQPGGLTIDASPERYIPFMSSTVGIRLTPHFETSADVVYNWTTDYGYFVSWNETDGKVTLHDQSIETEEPSIYWSYPPDDMGIEKPPVTIRLVVQTARLIHGGGGGRGTIAWEDIHIAWEDTDTAVTEK